MANIGNKIKEKRIENGWSQEELAKRMGYKSKSTINKIEKGINDITQSNIVKFAEILHTTPAYLMGWDVDEIETISNIQNDANTYDDAHEAELKELFVEFSKMDITPEELNFMKSIAASMTHEALGIFHKLYDLNMNIDELKDVFNYASYIRSKRE